MRCMVMPKYIDKSDIAPKYYSKGYDAEINLLGVPICDYDSTLSAMAVVCYYDPTELGHKIVTSYGRIWLLQHDLEPCSWLSDSQLAEVIKYYSLDKEAYDSE